MKEKSPSAYAFSTGLSTFLRGESGEFGTSCDGGCLTEDGNVDARGVGSTSSISSSAGDDDAGTACSVLTESLRCTCRSGDLSKPSLEGVLKLKDLAGSDSYSNDLSMTGPGLSTDTGRFRRAVALSAAEHSMPASSADTLTSPRVGTELLLWRGRYGRPCCECVGMMLVDGSNLDPNICCSRSLENGS